MDQTTNLYGFRDITLHQCRDFDAILKLTEENRFKGLKATIEETGVDLRGHTEDK